MSKMKNEIRCHQTLTMMCPYQVDWAEPEHEVDEETMSTVKVTFNFNVKMSTVEVTFNFDVKMSRVKVTFNFNIKMSTVEVTTMHSSNSNKK